MIKSEYLGGESCYEVESIAVVYRQAVWCMRKILLKKLVAGLKVLITHNCTRIETVLNEHINTNEISIKLSNSIYR